MYPYPTRTKPGVHRYSFPDLMGAPPFAWEALSNSMIRGRGPRPPATAGGRNAPVPPDLLPARCFPLLGLLFFLLSPLWKLDTNFSAACLATHIHPCTKTEHCLLKRPHQGASASVTSGQLRQNPSYDVLRVHVEAGMQTSLQCAVYSVIVPK